MARSYNTRTAKPAIAPVADPEGTYRQQTLRGLSSAQITRILGFAPNVQDDPDKVENSWGFTVNGELCAVWDYKGSHHGGVFSAFGPLPSLIAVFGAAVAA